MSRRFATGLASVGAWLALTASAGAQAMADFTIDPDSGVYVVHCHSNFICIPSTCGAAPGTPMRESKSLSYAGCKNTLVPGTPPVVICTGVCTVCTSPSPPTIGACRPTANDTTCCISANFGTANCGTPTGVSCVFAATPPAGEPYPAPNSCYCTGAPGATTGGCIASNCI